MFQECIENATQVFKELAAIPSVTKGSLFFTENHHNKDKLEASITSQWTQRDLVRQENRKFQRNHIVTCDRDPKKIGPIQEPSLPVELQNVYVLVSIIPLLLS